MYIYYYTIYIYALYILYILYMLYIYIRFKSESWPLFARINLESQLMWHPVVFDVTNAVSGEDGTLEVSRSRKRGAQMLGLWGCVETTNPLIFCRLEEENIYTI